MFSTLKLFPVLSRFAQNISKSAKMAIYLEGCVHFTERSPRKANTCDERLRDFHEILAVNKGF